MKNFKFKTTYYSADHRETVIRIFSYCLFALSVSKNNGWVRIFGQGIKWTDKSVKPLFSERMGYRKTITIGNYRYGYLPPEKSITQHTPNEEGSDANPFWR